MRSPARLFRRPLAVLALAVLVVPALSACLAALGPDGPGMDGGSLVDLAHLACDPDCNVLATPVNGPLNEVDIAISPTDPDRLLAGGKDYTFGRQMPCGDFNIYSGVYWSGDGGTTWGNTHLPGHPEDDSVGVLTPFWCISDPVVAFSPDGGTAYYLGLAETYGPSEGTSDARNALTVARSTDGGETWRHEDVSVVTVNHAPLVFNDKEWMAVGPEGTVYVVWAGFLFNFGEPVPDVAGELSSNQVLLSRSIDGGQTWSPPLVLGEITDQVERSYSQGAFPAVAPDGTVHVIWREFADPVIKMVTSTDQGLTFSEPRVIADFTPQDEPLENAEYRTPMNPQMAVDADGTLAAAYGDFDGGHYDVKVVTSEDGGATWSDPVTVNDDGTETDQFFPAITAGPTGALRDDFHMVWYDRRDTGNANLTVYYAASEDGLSWSPNLRVTMEDFDGNLGYHQRGFPFIGDYIGVAVGPDHAHAFWADTRTGESLGWTAKVALDAVPGLDAAEIT